ncbi:MAG: hypothetical protein M3P40_02470 [Actinomycetota bacterium]|nr:hypothetical protein [Actinomycetota bacterium]
MRGERRNQLVELVRIGVRNYGRRSATTWLEQGDDAEIRDVGHGEIRHAAHRRLRVQ